MLTKVLEPTADDINVAGNPFPFVHVLKLAPVREELLRKLCLRPIYQQCLITTRQGVLIEGREDDAVGNLQQNLQIHPNTPEKQAPFSVGGVAWHSVRNPLPPLNMQTTSYSLIITYTIVSPAVAIRSFVYRRGIS